MVGSSRRESSELSFFFFFFTNLYSLTDRPLIDGIAKLMVCALLYFLAFTVSQFALVYYHDYFSVLYRVYACSCISYLTFAILCDESEANQRFPRLVCVAQFYWRVVYDM